MPDIRPGTAAVVFATHSNGKETPLFHHLLAAGLSRDRLSVYRFSPFDPLGAPQVIVPVAPSNAPAGNGQKAVSVLPGRAVHGALLGSGVWCTVLPGST